MLNPAELKSHRTAVEQQHAASVAWMSAAPGTKRNREATLILLHAQTIAMSLLVDLLEANTEILMLRNELAERDSGASRGSTQ
jgi:hypothetical protein